MFPVKFNPDLNTNLTISKIYIPWGPVMFLPRKCMFKDGSFCLALVKSATILQFPGNISRSRWTSENLFILFESTYIGAVFVIKISAGSHIVLTGERLNHAENLSFYETPFRVTRTGGLVTSFIISSYGNKDTIIFSGGISDL